jgi:hypothetical protein
MNISGENSNYFVPNQQRAHFVRGWQKFSIIQALP